MYNSKNKMKNVLFLLCFIIGVGVALQVKATKNDTVFYSKESIKELELQVLMEQTEVQRLEEFLQRKNQEYSQLAAVEEKGALLGLLDKQREMAMSMMGFSSFQGEGLKIEIRDSDADLMPNQNPNDFIVHDQDVLRIINDLKVGGAEVLSVNNQIYKSNSEIKCSGPTITINGKTFGQPFVIRAIGDTDTMEAAIKSKDSYSYMIGSVFGIRIDTYREDNIQIVGTKTYKEFLYMEEARD